MASANDPTYDYYLIIPHAAEPQILLTRDDTSWSLPHWEVQGWRWWSDIAPINDMVRRRFALDATTLRCLGTTYHPESGRESRLYIMENHSHTRTPPAGARWVDRAVVAERALTRPEHRALRDMLRAWAEDDLRAPSRTPWYVPGWFRGTVTWIREELDRLDILMTAPIGQLRHSQRGCVLRVPTTAGDLYFKALPAFFAHEVPLTRLLSAHYPTNTVRLVTADATRNWMLMRDVGGPLLDAVPDIDRWEEAVRRYAQIQIDQAPHVERLLALGCPDRRVDGIVAAIEPLLADTEAMTVPGRRGGLSPTEVDRLRRLAPHLEALCADLARYDLPATLEHGDLYGQNIAATAAGAVYFDWTDSGVTHPFFIMLTWLTDFAAVLPGVIEARARLRAAYLHPWTTYAPMGRLIEAFELAQRVAPLYYALIQRDVRARMEARWEMELGVPMCLRRVLAREA